MLRGRIDGTGDFVAELERVARDIGDPVERLRFIRAALARHHNADTWIRRIPWRPARRALYRWMGLQMFQELLVQNALGAPRAITTVRRRLMVGRLAIASAAVLAPVAALIAWQVATRPHVGSVAAAMPAAPARGVPLADIPTVPPPPLPPPAPPGGVAPAAIWLVEKGPGFEQYSNGLRIETALAVEGSPRVFHAFDEAGELLPETLTRPVGILFHTSESDVWPLDPSFNGKLRDSSQRLLKYVQRNKLYNYVIDRFGRVYRIVEESSKANHAGHSVWGDGGRVYMNLNHAFLGVSFETRWEGGRALPITQAQFAAGRNLTDHLRQQYGIAPTMCVAHGLTSVNPKKGLIGHHVDWARGFPFEAYGLPDQYRVPAASVAVFGFGYDGDFVAAAGEPWPGVAAAERVLAAEAARAGTTVEALRAEKKARYERWMEAQAQRDADAAGALGLTRTGAVTAARAFGRKGS
jgi:hypothetical protein